MTFTEFKKLDNLSKELLCWSKGVVVATRQNDSFHFKLYQVFSFYIEIQYNLHFETLNSFSAFENTDQLEPYLAELNIDSLYY